MRFSFRVMVVVMCYRMVVLALVVLTLLAMSLRTLALLVLMMLETACYRLNGRLN